VAAGIDTYIVTGKPWEETKKGIRGRTNLGMFDLSASYVDLGSGGFQLGLDTVGELFDFGVRGEIAMILPGGADRYFQTVLGSNYTLENGWGLELEYFINGKPLGMDYLYLGTNKILDEISGVRYSLLLNADDLSFIFYPVYTRNLIENLDMSLEAMLRAGAEGTEFMDSNLVLARMRYSF